MTSSPPMLPRQTQEEAKGAAAAGVRPAQVRESEAVGALAFVHRK